MVDERIDPRDISAGLVSLAVKGCIEIVPKTEGTLFKKQKADIVVKPKPPPAHLSLFEDKLYSALGSPGETLDETDLRSKVGTKIETLKPLIFEELVNRGFYRASPTTVVGCWGCGTTAVIVLLGVIATFATPAASALPAVVGGLTALIAAGPLIKGMPRRTPLGAKVRSRVLGFEEFIKRARGREIDWVTQKHPDQALFEEYLPYAIAFGLAKEWAAAFVDIPLTQPAWYRADATGTFNPIFFVNDLDAVNSNLSAAVTTRPRSSGAGGGSSGFGGGGFSGGGFGGGGGRSW